MSPAPVVTMGSNVATPTGSPTPREARRTQGAADSFRCWGRVPLRRREDDRAIVTRHAGPAGLPTNELNGLSSVTDLGVSFTIEEMIEMLVSPVNGRWPVAIS
jgi:hypothetical protein